MRSTFISSLLAHQSLEEEEEDDDKAETENQKCENPGNTAKETGLRMPRFYLLMEAYRFDDERRSKKIWKRRPVTYFGSVGSPPKTKEGEEKGCTGQNLLSVAD